MHRFSIFILCVAPCVVLVGASCVAAENENAQAPKQAPPPPEAPPKAEKIEKRKGVTIHYDIEYAKVGDHSLKLDLYMPTNVKRKPHLVVFFHGGSWRAGSKKTCHVSWLTRYGYAVASVDYRLTKVAIFPALVHDCKGSIRFLRAHADHYGYEPKRMGVSGASAGGLLAALVATSGGIKELEGKVCPAPRRPDPGSLCTRDRG